MAGPRLSDKAFFEALNLDDPALREVKGAVDQEDWSAARQAFAAHLRSREKPVWFFDWRNRTEPDTEGDTEVVRVGGRAARDVDMETADKAVRNVLRSCRVEQDFGDEINWELDPINYKEWTWQLSRHPFWVTLGQAYWKTEDEQYTEAFVRQMTHWVENVLVPVGEDGNGWKGDAKMGTDRTNCWRTIECGIRMGQTWPNAFFYFLSSPTFTDDAVCLMVKSMAEHARHLMQWPRSGNWLTMEANGMYHVGVLFPEFKEAAEWRKVAMERLYRELDVQVYPDGAQIELSSGYHQVSLRNFVMALYVGRLNDQAIPEDYAAKLERMYHYDLYLAMPDLRMPALNDGSWTDVRPYLRRALRFFPKRDDFRWAATEGAEGTRPETLSCAFPYAGHFVMRAGWEADDAYMFFDGGPFGYGHQHEDKLNIVVYAHGRVHVTDPGNYPYDSSQWRKYVLSTRAHNTVMVDGMEQNQRGQSRDRYVVSEPLPHTWISTSDYDYASASYGEGYGSERDRTVTHTRSILFIKPALWIVTDILTPSDNALHRYEAMFHLDAEDAEVLEGAAGVETRNDGAGNLGIYGLASEAAAVEVVSGQESPIVQGWIPRGGPYECQPIPTAVFRTEGTGPVVMSYVISPIPKDRPSPVSYVGSLAEVSSDLPAIAGHVEFRNGSQAYFVQRCAGEGWVRNPRAETDAEAVATIVKSNGAVERICMVNGTVVKTFGDRLQVGDRI